ncbi:6,7-dimethyl-8-ribityllumazine synthase [Micractinium conductrix]|uniref:6,7-dimethyl-8-ribityllumazine synthase n=1 Tax=Micractinium conductrix TaxID=554055 RepID=A0A2P6VAX8_9CHLO|nr:6,7-dimethyl-8-ribityllumazine synthase [Micractinium conductrix]|eukprot:PSC71225.1 6,7-dimethyl-8-ribityllumazine synthase [Micractinium conductrix]
MADQHPGGDQSRGGYYPPPAGYLPPQGYPAGYPPPQVLNSTARPCCAAPPRFAMSATLTTSAAQQASARVGSQRSQSRPAAMMAAHSGRLVAAPAQGQAAAAAPARRRAALAVRAAGKAYEGSLVGTGMKFGVVVGRFNDLVTKLLLEGCVGAFERHGVAAEDVDVAWVPGSFELPVVAKAMAKGGKYDAVVAIGVVVRGDTTHYDAVVGGATSGVLNASTDSGVPVIFGVLTCDTMEQALDRAGGKVGNKGGEAAVTAVETGSLLRQLRGEGKAAQPW